MVEEDQPERDPAEQIEPQVASSADHRGVHSGDLSVGDGCLQTLVNLPAAWDHVSATFASDGLKAMHYVGTYTTKRPDGG
jgi:hypothetical protein